MMKMLHATVATLLIFALASVNAQRNMYAPLWSRIPPLESSPSECLGADEDADRMPVLIYDCSKEATIWTWPENPMYVVEPSGQFKIGDSNFCLDAQTDNPDGDGWLGVIIFTCNNSPQQNWVYYRNPYTPEGPISLRSRSRCLDVRGSSKANGTQVGTFPCSKMPENERLNQFFAYVASNYNFRLDTSIS